MENNTALTNSETMSKLKPTKSLKDILTGDKIKIQEKVDKVLLVLLDASGSMLDHMETASKIEVAWKVLIDELMPNMTGWAYGVLVFQGSEDALWKVIPTKQTTALTTYDRPSAGGGTPMRKVLEQAWAWVMHNAKEARFILLSDGCPTDGPSEQILAIAEENKSIPIDTVGIGVGSQFHSYDPIFLWRLSQITGGMFVEVSTVKMLAGDVLKLSPAQRLLLGPVIERS